MNRERLFRKLEGYKTYVQKDFHNHEFYDIGFFKDKNLKDGDLVVLEYVGFGWLVKLSDKNKILCGNCIRHYGGILKLYGKAERDMVDIAKSFTNFNNTQSTAQRRFRLPTNIERRYYNFMLRCKNKAVE